MTETTTSKTCIFTGTIPNVWTDFEGAKCIVGTQRIFSGYGPLQYMTPVTTQGIC